jgi:hypothetical protein
MKTKSLVLSFLLYLKVSSFSLTCLELVQNSYTSCAWKNCKTKSEMRKCLDTPKIIVSTTWGADSDSSTRYSVTGWGGQFYKSMSSGAPYVILQSKG